MKEINMNFKGLILKTSRINAFEFLRLLDALIHERLVATEAEIRERIHKDSANTKTT